MNSVISAKRKPTTPQHQSHNVEQPPNKIVSIDLVTIINKPQNRSVTVDNNNNNNNNNNNTTISYTLAMWKYLSGI